MAGSILIHETDPASLRSAGTDLDELLEKRTTLELDVLITLDFETMLSESAASWTQGEPLLFDEELGLVILEVNPASLRALLEQPRPDDPEVAGDLAKIASFVDRHGDAHIFEVATF